MICSFLSKWARECSMGSSARYLRLGRSGRGGPRCCDARRGRPPMGERPTALPGCRRGGAAARRRGSWARRRRACTPRLRRAARLVAREQAEGLLELLVVKKRQENAPGGRKWREVVLLCDASGREWRGAASGGRSSSAARPEAGDGAHGEPASCGGGALDWRGSGLRPLLEPPGGRTGRVPQTGETGRQGRRPSPRAGAPRGRRRGARTSRRTPT